MLIFYNNAYQVYRLKTKRCGCYLISYKNKNVLIDTSMKFERNTLIRELRRLDKRQIDALFITHNHKDHIANAEWLANKYNCSIYISKKSIEEAKKGRALLPRPTIMLATVICWFIKHGKRIYDFCKYEPCLKIYELNDHTVDKYLGEGVKLIQTTGHTKDSVSFIINDEIAIVGDAMVNRFGNTYPPFAEDKELVKVTWENMLNTNVSYFYPSHGKVITRSTLKKNTIRLK